MTLKVIFLFEVLAMALGLLLLDRVSRK